MTRKHPQNGPSFSKAPHKKHKPLSDDELAAMRARQKEHEDKLREKAAAGKRFSKAVRAAGNTIPIRGEGAKQFWTGLKDDPEQSERFIKTAREHGADETEKGADKAFKKVIWSTKAPKARS